jgi:hypothetical protein
MPQQHLLLFCMKVLLMLPTLEHPVEIRGGKSGSSVWHLCFTSCRFWVQTPCRRAAILRSVTPTNQGDPMTSVVILYISTASFRVPFTLLLSRTSIYRNMYPFTAVSKNKTSNTRYIIRRSLTSFLPVERLAELAGGSILYTTLKAEGSGGLLALFRRPIRYSHRYTLTRS